VKKRIHFEMLVEQEALNFERQCLIEHIGPYLTDKVHNRDEQEGRKRAKIDPIGVTDELLDLIDAKQRRSLK